jgi:Ca2+-binding RTX toxin-like protein
MGRRLAVLLAATAMVVSMIAVAGMAWAQEAEPTPIPSETPDNTWMTNGVVYSTIRSGDYIYVGGKFTRARSAVSGGKSFAATNLARFDADTGVGDPTWTPDVTGADTATTVYALAAAGGNIWVGGHFNAVDGVARRNLAAVSEDTGAVDPGVDLPVGSTNTSNRVRDLMVSETVPQKVYVGGTFSTIDGQGRPNLGAVNLNGELDPAWRPKTQGAVHTLEYSCDRATVFAGGAFKSAADSTSSFATRYFLARFDASNGALHPWAVPVESLANDEVASDIAVACERQRLAVAYRGPNWNRAIRLDNGDTGSVVWAKKSGGESHTVTMLGPDKAVFGGHFGQWDGVKVAGIALINLSDGSVDLSWNPTLEAGGTGFITIWETLVDENHLYIGGLFNKVEGLPRTHLARFSWPVPDTTSPTISSVFPADGVTDAAVNTNVEATFSEEMDEASVESPGNFALTKDSDGSSVAASVDYDPATNKATLDPDVTLDAQATYTATVKGGTDGVKDSAGNALANDEMWTFTTTLPCTISGTSGAETITGTSGDDVICAGAGNDTVQALEGNDTIKGEGGADQLHGGIGDDRLEGGAGTDTANFTASVAPIDASLEAGTATGEGSDTFSEVENLTGSNLADTLLEGSEANNTLNGLGGNDNIVGLGGADTLKGGGGPDTLNSQDGVEGNDAVDGGTGTDTCQTDATELSILNCELP